MRPATDTFSETLPPCPRCGTAGVVVGEIPPVVIVSCPACRAGKLKSRYFVERITSGVNGTRPDPAAGGPKKPGRRARVDPALRDRLIELYRTGKHTTGSAARACGVPEKVGYNVIRYYHFGNKGGGKRKNALTSPRTVV